MTGRRWEMGATRRLIHALTGRRRPAPDRRRALGGGERPRGGPSADRPGGFRGEPVDLIGSGRLDGALVDWAYYHDGHRATRHKHHFGRRHGHGDAGREELDYPTAVERVRRGDGFVWLGLFEPDREQLELVGTAFGLHRLALEDADRAHRRPKLQRHGDTLFAVLKTVRYVPHDDLTATSEVVETGEVMVCCGPGFVLTIRHGDHGELVGLRQELEQQPDRLAAGPGAVLHGVADHVVDSYLAVAASVQGDIDRIENEMFTPRGWRQIDRVYQLKREVMELKRAVAPLTGPMRMLAKQPHPLVSDEIRAYFRDVDDHLLRVKEQVLSFDELLSSILQAGLAQLQVSENEDMRRISAWVAIVAVPTLVAGIWGMNFDNLPAAHSRYGYYVVMAAMLVCCAGLYRLFKRNHWL